MAFGSVEWQQTFYGGKIQEKISFPSTEEQNKLEKTMMKAWTAFAKDPDNGLEKEMKWPVYDPTSKFCCHGKNC
jgi:carboxylesterase type B